MRSVFGPRAALSLERVARETGASKPTSMLACNLGVASRIGIVLGTAARAPVQ